VIRTRERLEEHREDARSASLGGAQFEVARAQLAAMLDLPLGLEAARRLHAQIPELQKADLEEGLFDETVASCTANTREICRLLLSGAPAAALVVPAAAVDFAQGLVRRRIPLPVLLRAYRVGHQHVWEAAARILRDSPLEGYDLLSALEATSSFLFEYVDEVCDQVVTAYHVERDRWVRSSAAVRAEVAREILEGGRVDADAASKRLGYVLDRHHVALILSAELNDAGGSDSLERQAIGAAAALGCGEPLMVPAGRAILWAWCGTYTEPNPAAVDRLERFVPGSGVRIAVGRPRQGPDGFRVSHTEAHYASQFWSVAGTSATIAYRDIELVSLLSTDHARAQRFVESVLGDLAAPTDAASALRETLLAFLAHGGSYRNAAEGLYVHKNTVYTRVRRAEEMLGHDVTTHRVELQAALMLMAVAGGGEL